VAADKSRLHGRAATAAAARRGVAQPRLGADGKDAWRWQTRAAYAERK
jgi:hypothetical protein